MKHTIIWVLLLGAVTILGLKMIGNDAQPQAGQLAPDFTVTRNDSTFTLQDLRGKYVLVDFWSSSDANSRIKSNEYNRLPVYPSSRFERLSINFDRSEQLFDEIVKRDHLNKDEQYFATETDCDKIINSYKLSEGYNSYLIAPDGKIVAVNPDNTYLSDYFGRQAFNAR